MMPLLAKSLPSPRILRIRGNRRVPGFTLIELLVSIGLLVLLGAIVAAVFYNATEIFRRTQAKIEIFQNARYSLNLMGRELSCTTAYMSGAPTFAIGTPDWTTPNPTGGGRFGIYLSFPSHTAYIDYVAATRYVGIERVVYKLVDFPAGNPNRHTLQRELYDVSATATDPLHAKIVNSDFTAPVAILSQGTGNPPLALQDNLCEYVQDFSVSYLSWYMNFAMTQGDRFVFPWPSDSGANWTPDSALNYAFATGVSPAPANYIYFDGKEQEIVGTGGKKTTAFVSSLIRVSMTVTDTQERENRLFTRTFWIPTANPPVQ